MNSFRSLHSTCLRAILLAGIVATPALCLAQGSASDRTGGNADVIDTGASRATDPTRENDRKTEPGRDNATAASSSSSSARAGMTPAAAPKRPAANRNPAQPRRTRSNKPVPATDDANVAVIGTPPARNQDPAVPSSM